MDNEKLLSEKLLQADGLTPNTVSPAEREILRRMLRAEQKEHSRLSWLSVYAVWIWALLMLALCIFSDALERIGIPVVVSFFVAVVLSWFVLIRYGFRHNKRLRETGTKVLRFHYLLYGRHKGLVLVGRKGGKRHIYWLRFIIIAVVLWLFMFFGGAGVFYMLCGRSMFQSVPWYHILLSTSFSLSFVGYVLHWGLKTPVNRLPETEEHDLDDDGD